MSRYIDRVHLMNRIATECHYDIEHPLESYSKLLEVINEECGFDGNVWITEELKAEYGGVPLYSVHGEMIINEEGEPMQYCRYCNSMCCGDANYCSTKRKTLSDSYIKRPNYCPYFEFNPIDALGENKRGYKPREEKQEVIEGQLTIWEGDE